MGEFLKQYDREYMKMAMLKHEETFKHQVHELHRLYRIQKILMNDMKAELKKQQTSANSQRNKACKSYTEKGRMHQTLDLELNAEEYIGKEDKNGTVKVEEEGELELTLATGSRRKKDESSFTSDSEASFSWSSAESSGVKLKGNEWGLCHLNSFQSERKSAFDVEGQVRQNRLNQPPWLLQCLSLNMA